MLYNSIHKLTCPQRYPQTKPRGGKRSKGDGEEVEHGDRSLPADLSRRVLRLAREQDQEEAGPAGKDAVLSAAALAALEAEEPDSDEDLPSPGPGSVWDEDEDIEYEHLSPEDEAALAAFMRPSGDAPKARTLGDIIAEKLAQQRQERRAGGDER